MVVRVSLHGDDKEYLSLENNIPRCRVVPYTIFESHRDGNDNSCRPSDALLTLPHKRSYMRMATKS